MDGLGGGHFCCTERPAVSGCGRGWARWRAAFWQKRRRRAGAEHAREVGIIIILAATGRLILGNGRYSSRRGVSRPPSWGKAPPEGLPFGDFGERWRGPWRASELGGMGRDGEGWWEEGNCWQKGKEKKTIQQRYGVIIIIINESDGVLLFYRSFPGMKIEMAADRLLRALSRDAFHLSI